MGQRFFFFLRLMCLMFHFMSICLILSQKNLMCFTWGIPLGTRQAPLTLAGGRGIDFFLVPDFAGSFFP